MSTRIHRNGVAIVTMAVLMLVGSIAPCLAAEMVRTGGTGASVGLVQVLGAAFEKLNPDVKVQAVPSLGSSGGIKAVSQGVLDISICSRPLAQDEQQPGLVESKWVNTPFVIVTKQDSSSRDMQLAQLERIYAGAVTRWPNGERIRLVLRPAAESDTRLAKAISPVLSRAIDSLLSLEGVLIAVNDQDCQSMVSKIPGSLSFTTLAQVLTEKRPLSVFSYNGVAPSTRTMVNGTYPLVKSLYMVSKSTPTAVAKRFLDFIRSDAGRAILIESGAVPQ